MLVKFETKSQRVKGIAFHPTRPWILASLHSGTIQLWDYRIGSLIDKYEEHEGPVRGICFHQTQPLFISGGDDYKIKGWNYKLKKCIFTLTGHIDYIRTIQFHYELPWILSSSDDQTIRIWNYQSRQLITILTGHSHYVMCAQFHPTKNLIVSCSLDQQIRVWDYTILRNKSQSSVSSQKSGKDSGIATSHSGDVELKYILEGHDRGVNWVSFHPTQNLILSGADDRKVKLWKYTESKAWEHDSLYGHTNNVSCVQFHKNLDIMISNSEDKSIRIWDLNKRTLIETYKRENDRFWILTGHPTQNIVAAGSDSGMIVFNLTRESIPFQVIGAHLYYIYKKNIFHYNIAKNITTSIKTLEYTPQSLIYNVPRSIQVSSYEQNSINILVQFDNSDTQFHKNFLYQFEGDPDLSNLKEKSKKGQKYSYSNYCLQSVFLGKGKLIKIGHDKKMNICDYNQEIYLKTIDSIKNAEMIYPGPLGKFIVKTDESIILYDTTFNKIIAQYDGIEAPHLKRVLWNQNYSMVALACKKNLILLNKNFQKVCNISEKFNIKSMIWNHQDNTLFYNTINHVKYTLLNGDNGIIQCLDKNYLLFYMDKDHLHMFDNQSNIQKIDYQTEDYLFKLALHNRNLKQIKHVLDNHKRLGESLIAYLYKKKYSALALNLVNNPQAKFSLAINSGNLEVAFKTCMQLKDPECFKKLGEEALRQGNHQLVEIAYQNQSAYEKLSFLYLITGNFNKLEKMLLIAQNRGDIQNRFLNALYLGDIHERIRILAEIGQLPLAYMLAVTHNIQDMAAQLKNSLSENLANIDFSMLNSQALIPPKPLIMDPSVSSQSTMNWPHNNIEEEDLLTMRDIGVEEESANQEIEENKDDLANLVDNRFNDTQLDLQDDQNVKQVEEKAQDNVKWGNEDDDDLDIPDQQIQEVTQQQSQNIELQSNITPGTNNILQKSKTSQFAGIQVACGQFENAFQLLKRQIGAYEFKPFKKIFLQIQMASSLQLSNLAIAQPLEFIVRDEPNSDNIFVIGSIISLQNELKQAYKYTTEYKLQEAIDKFNQILLQIPLLYLKNPADRDDVMSLIRISQEYSLALICEQTKANNQNNPLRSLELSAYLSMCNVQPAHRILFLKSSMILAYKQKDFIYASYFAKKLVQLGELYPNATNAEQIQKAKKVYQACEQQGSNEHKIQFEEKWLNDNDAVFKICAKSLKIIDSKDAKRCPYDGSRYSPEFDGQICQICRVSKIGIESMGLKITNN